MKYLVMETFTSYAVVLDEEGRFIKTANLGYTAGQTVDEIFPMLEDVSVARAEAVPAKNKPIYFKKLARIAACFVIMAAGLLTALKTPYGSVYISINPSVRIDVDKKDIVQTVTGTNADGIALVENYNGKGKALKTAVDELIDLAIDMGYLADGGQVNVTLDGETAWVENHSRDLPEHINNYVKEKITITIRVGDYSTGTQVTIPATDYGESDYRGVDDPATDYNDTDYGPDNDGVTEYDRPEEQTPYQQSDYRATGDGGESNFTDGLTDYEADETSPYEEDSHSEYSNSDYE